MEETTKPPRGRLYTSKPRQVYALKAHKFSLARALLRIFAHNERLYTEKRSSRADTHIHIHTRAGAERGIKAPAFGVNSREDLGIVMRSEVRSRCFLVLVIAHNFGDRSLRSLAPSLSHSLCTRRVRFSRQSLTVGLLLLENKRSSLNKYLLGRAEHGWSNWLFGRASARSPAVYFCQPRFRRVTPVSRCRSERERWQWRKRNNNLLVYATRVCAEC